MSTHRTARLLGLPVVLAIVSGCASTPPAPSAAPAPSSPVGSASSAPAAGVDSVALRTPLDHVHGLAVGSDGALLAGTHTGVVALDLDGGVTRVGDGSLDLMGFTGVPGTDRLASSGHPGAGSSLPDPVGLLASDDGGSTWRSVALQGEVDFHALASDGRLVVGYDGRTGLLVSDDGGARFRPGAAIAPAALAVTPEGVWATTSNGLQRSVDGGASFAVVDGAPTLVLLAAGPDGSLWGVDVQGRAWRSTDGTGWEAVGAVGAVEAIAVAGFDRAYAVTAERLDVLG